MDATVSLPALDEEGYLVEPGDWNEAVAEHLARAEGVWLTDEHWDVIRFMREYYEEHQIAPDARYVIKHLSNRLGATRATHSSSCLPMATSSRHARSPG